MTRWIERYDSRGLIEAVRFTDDDMRHQIAIAETHNRYQSRVGRSPGWQHVRVVEREES